MMQLKFILIPITLLVISLSAWAGYTQTLLVLDMRNVPQLPKHFRTTSDDLPTTKQIDVTGLSDLHIAGGAQFSRLALKKILRRLQHKNLTIIDLREESHGFLNGNAISWYAPGDAANAGKTPAQIERDQAQRLTDLEKFTTVRVNIILQKAPNGEIQATKKMEYRIHHVFSEAQLAESAGLNYLRIYVADFHAPKPKEVDRFIQSIKNLPADQWIYFHCRAGVGRTTTFMVMYDMMRNAKRVSFKQILARQQALGGKDLASLPEQGQFKYQYAAKRLQFLKDFYQYCRSNKDDFATSWTKWLNKA